MSFTSPYNFIPLPSKVVFPSWQTIEQDAPEPEGVCGEIELSITNLTPLIIGDDASGQDIQPFFKIHQDGQAKPAIPGSSIKGMIRSIVELATASYLHIEDNQFSQRDLTSAKNEYMTAIKPRKSGWLKFNKSTGEWLISPTQEPFKTIRHTSKTNNNSKNVGTDVSSVLEDEFPSLKIHQIEHAKERYEAVEAVEAVAEARPKAKKIGACIELFNQQYLVMTNQLKGSSKCREFLFSPANDKGQGIVIEESVFTAFQAVMDESQTEVGAEHWSYLKKYSAEGIPVFYLLDQNKKITSFGLASLYRLPYSKSVHDLLPQDQQNRAQKMQLDFCDLLFGSIAQPKQNTTSRKGRINIGLATTTQPFKFEDMSFVLSNPKATFYPAYLKQQAGEVKTYNTASGISGAKAYLAHQNIKKYELPKGADGEPNTNLETNVQALTSTNIFTTKIRCHNLLPEEVGALIWAIQFGYEKDKNNIHLLGMGKPLGYGKVQLSINKLNFIANNTQAQSLNQTDYLNKFYAYLGLHQLLGEKTLATLKAVHQNDCMSDQELRYLRLDPSNKKDEFLQVIKDKKTLKPIESTHFENVFKQIEKTLKPAIQALKDKQAQLKDAALKKADEKLKAQKEEQEQLKKEAQRQSRSPLIVLIEDDLNNKLDKNAINLLSQSPELWKTLSEREQAELAQKIKISDYYKNSNSKVRKKIRTKLGGLGNRMT